MTGLSAGCRGVLFCSQLHIFSPIDPPPTPSPCGVLSGEGSWEKGGASHSVPLTRSLPNPQDNHNSARHPRRMSRQQRPWTSVAMAVIRELPCPSRLPLQYHSTFLLSLYIVISLLSLAQLTRPAAAAVGCTDITALPAYKQATPQSTQLVVYAGGPLSSFVPSSIPMQVGVGPMPDPRQRL